FYADQKLQQDQEDIVAFLKQVDEYHDRNLANGKPYLPQPQLSIEELIEKMSLDGVSIRLKKPTVPLVRTWHSDSALCIKKSRQPSISLESDGEATAPEPAPKPAEIPSYDPYPTADISTTTDSSYGFLLDSESNNGVWD